MFGYCSEPLPSMATETLPTDLSSPKSFFLEFSSSSQSGGFGIGRLSPGPYYFVSRVLEELTGWSEPVTMVFPSSSGRQREVKSPVRKKPKSILRKRVPSLAVGDGVMMENLSIYSKHALDGHARGKHLSLGFLIKWAITNWGSKVSSPPVVSRMTKGWFVFLLSSKVEANTVLAGMWEMARVPIML